MPRQRDHREIYVFCEGMIIKKRTLILNDSKKDLKQLLTEYAKSRFFTWLITHQLLIKYRMQKQS